MGKGKTSTSTSQQQSGTKGTPVQSEPQTVTAAERAVMIAQAAYYRAEARVFTPGHDVEDWLAAEREIDANLAASTPVARLVETLQRERDELKLKIHLARLDARQEWDALEQKWQVIRSKSGGAVKEARAAGKDVSAAARNLLMEVGEGYKRIRRSL
jgi:hypothetical protein